MQSVSPSLERSAVAAATLRDVRALVELLGGSVPAVAAETVWEVPWTWQHYWIVRDASGDIVCAGSLRPLDDRRAEIRGLVVAPRARGTGIATVLVDHLLERADALGLEAVCVTRKPSFFRRFGFAETIASWVVPQRTLGKSSFQPTSRSPLRAGEGESSPRVAMVRSRLAA